jgi:hypothetical protein
MTTRGYQASQSSQDGKLCIVKKKKKEKRKEKRQREM